MTTAVLARTRRRSELVLGLLVVIVTGGGYILVALSDGPELPPDLWAFLGRVLGLYLVAHLAVRRFARGADATLLPLAAALNGIGFVTISRLDEELARVQAGWVAIGVVAFVVTLVIVRDTRLLEKYRYTFALLGVLFLLLPLLPGIGRTLNGARLWASIGPLNFQPGELAKVLLVVFFASYLADHRDLLAAGSVRIGRFFVPALRHLGPLALAWGCSILVMVYEKDLGSSLLFFGVFAAMLYMATGRAYYLVVGLVLFLVGVFIAYQIFGHVQVRASIRGSTPGRIPPATASRSSSRGSRSVRAASPGRASASATPTHSQCRDRLRLLGHRRGARAHRDGRRDHRVHVAGGQRVRSRWMRDPFSKLFAAGLATIVGLQTVISRGVTRVIPLTGITLPFVSYGGSSLVANFIVLALLLACPTRPHGRGRIDEPHDPPRRRRHARVVRRPGRAGHVPPDHPRRRPQERSEQRSRVPPRTTRGHAG